MKKVIIIALAVIAARAVIAGTITGVVTDDLTGLPIAEIWVQVSDYTTGQFCDGYGTNSEGHYSISNLEAGTYRVEAAAWDDSYIPEFYDNALNYEDATPVTVTSLGVTENIDFGLAIRGGIIRGTVIDSNGQPVAGMRINACGYDTFRCYGDITNSEGHYSIRCFTVETYWVVAEPDLGNDYARQYYNGQEDWNNATPVVLNAGGVVEDINFQLAPGGSISGQVTDPNGQPVTDMQIYVWDYQTGQWRGGGLSDANGEYEIGGIPAGTYCIEARPDTGSNYAIQYYNGQDNWGKATPVVLNAGGVVEDINFQLVPGGSISGIVTDPNGQPAAYIVVNTVAYPDGSYGFGGRTDSNGVYEIWGLPAGLYRVMVWAEDTIYASQFYNNKIAFDQATPVNVLAGQQTTGIDFSLVPGASISGVVKNSSGEVQSNVLVNCWAEDGYGAGTWTDATGYYKCGGLPVGYIYNVIAYPPADSDYMITKIHVEVYLPGEYTDKDIIFGEGGLTISGTIADKATMLPLADVRVGCWNDDVEVWSETRTEPNGVYRLTNLSPGEEVGVNVEPESYYAYMGAELELEEDINNLDFALPAGATLCGRVLDANTAEPLIGVEVGYSSEENSVGRSQFTEVDGTFCLTQLPPGIAELKAFPEVDSGYSWNLPWGSDFVCLGEGEERLGRIIALEKGALVSGYMKDADGNAFGGFEYCYSGRDCDGWDDTDINGFYQMRLPVGTYYITVDENEEFGALPAIVTVTDVNGEINVPDITVYTEEDGGQISGQVNNPGGYAKTGYFVILAFQTGVVPDDPDTWYTVQPVFEIEMEDAGAFSLGALPPGVNYDIYLCVENQGPDMESLAVRDSAFNVAVGTTGIVLDYNSQGSTVQGVVKNTDDKPVLGATVLLSSLSGFGGFGGTDCSGEYVIYNVPAGTYTVTAIHSKYLNAPTTVEVVEGAAADAGTIVMSFTGEKEGPDLNGDGNVDMADLMEFAGQWLNSGVSEADFNQDNEVNLYDWTQIAENWLSKAIWYHE